MIPAVPGLDIQWSIQPADAGAIVSGQGTDTVEVFWQSSGAHTLVVTACGQTTNYVVNVSPNLAPAVTHPFNLCAGNTATVQTAIPSATYSWETPGGSILSTADTVVLGPGNYILSAVTDANGCTGSTAFTIYTAPAPNLSISTADPTAFCNNSETVNMVALSNTLGDLTYEWFQNGVPLGVNAATYSTNQYGSYTVQATNAAGCTATAGPITVIEDCTGGGGGLPGGGLLDCSASGDISILSIPSPRCDSFSFFRLQASIIWPVRHNGFLSVPDRELSAVLPATKWVSLFRAPANTSFSSLPRLLRADHVRCLVRFPWMQWQHFQFCLPVREVPRVSTSAARFCLVAASAPGTGTSGIQPPARVTRLVSECRRIFMRQEEHTP